MTNTAAALLLAKLREIVHAAQAGDTAAARRAQAEAREMMREGQ